MICKNCNNAFEGNFCNNCGQSSKVNRIDYKFLFSEVPNNVFQLNRGLFFTIKKLSISPGKSIREYIGGKRKNYYNPFSYFIIVSAFYVLVTYLLGKNTFTADLISGIMLGIDDDEKSAISGVLNWVLKNQTYISLLFIPVFSLASYLAFIRSDYNYFEHLVLNLYIKGHQIIIHLILGLFIYEDNILSILPVLLSFIYNIGVYFQFFNNKRPLTKSMQILLTYVLVIAFIFSMIVLAVFISGSYN